MQQLAERGFSGDLGFGQKAALIVVDLINGFTDPTSPLGADVSPEIAQTARLLEAFRRRSLPIYFSSIEYDDPGASDAGIWKLKIAGLTTLVAGSHASSLDGRLGRLASEPIVRKKFASCFFRTDLVARLIAAQVDTLVLAGCTTSGCVRATVVDACQYGIRPIVAREAVADRLAEAHRQSLEDIAMKYGDVLAIEDILSIISPLFPAKDIHDE